MNRIMNNFIKKNLTRNKINYLLVGLFNTIFGYFIMIALYNKVERIIGIIGVSVLSNFVSISVSFTMYKLFVFKTKGSWVAEWAKSFVVYGVSAFFSTVLLVILLNYMMINIYISQLMVMTFVVVLSYVGNSRFTFSRVKK